MKFSSSRLKKEKKKQTNNWQSMGKDSIQSLDDISISLSAIKHVLQTCCPYPQTANAVASVLYQLACNPCKQAILYEEIERELPVEAMQIERSHLDKLRYVKACIKETLRLIIQHVLFQQKWTIRWFRSFSFLFSRMRPVVIGNGRCTTEETIIGGFRVPEGVCSFILTLER